MKPLPLQPKPLFLPLRATYYEAFASGEKVHEFRRHGRRWNATTCRVGRRVTLSCGYGKARRMLGTIVSFEVVDDVERLEGWVECYGADAGPAAVIGIELDGVVELTSAKQIQLDLVEQGVA